MRQVRKGWTAARYGLCSGALGGSNLALTVHAAPDQIRPERLTCLILCAADHGQRHLSAAARDKMWVGLGWVRGLVHERPPSYQVQVLMQAPWLHLAGTIDILMYTNPIDSVPEEWWVDDRPYLTLSHRLRGHTLSQRLHTSTGRFSAWCSTAVPCNSRNVTDGRLTGPPS